MSDHNNNFTDNSFSLHQAYSYSLLLQIEPTSFSFAITDQNRLLASAQNVPIDELTNPHQLNDLLSATYKRIIIGMPSSGLTLVPKKLFRDDKVAEFARFLDVKPNESVFAQTLDEQNVIVYKTSDALVNATKRFDLQNAVYTARGWLQAISKTRPSNNSLYMEVGKGIIQFLLYASGSLRYYNTFAFGNEDELAYFTSFVAGELNLKPQNTTLILSGDITYGDINMNRLAEFYPHIELNTLKVLELPGQLNPSKVLALAALSLCGSSEAH